VSDIKGTLRVISGPTGQRVIDDLNARWAAKEKGDYDCVLYMSANMWEPHAVDHCAEIRKGLAKGERMLLFGDKQQTDLVLAELEKVE